MAIFLIVILIILPFGGSVIPKEDLIDAKADFSLSGLININVCQNPSKYGFIHRNGTNKYYAIADLMMRWVEGENYCKSFGAHLPIPKNIDDVYFLRGKYTVLY